MRLLITGSEGFIGSRLVAQLLAQGHTVIGIDNLSLGQAAPAGRRGYVFRKLDIRDEEGVASVFGEFRPEEVVHLAAIHHIPTCESNPPEAFAVNVVGTQVILDAARRFHCQRVVLASSGAVYDWSDGPLAPDRSPVHPRDIYSVSKVTNEHQVAVWQVKTGGIVVVARLFNVIGPNDRNAHLIPDILRQLLMGGDARVVRLGNTTPRRDYVYVEDVAEALACMVAADLESGKHVFNVGSGREHTVSEVAQRLAAILTVPCVIETDPRLARPVDRPSQLANIEDTALRLGWAPRHEFDQALRLTAARP